MNNKIYLFAYGSMKKGFRNHVRLKEDKLIGSAVTVDKYNMYPAVSFNYPYGVENEKQWCLNGALFELISTDIKEIDIFEGCPNYYYRKEIEVLCNDKIYQSFIYFRTSTNPTGMDADIPIDTWTKEFENVGKKNEEFLDALVLALMESRSEDKATKEFLKKFKLEANNEKR